VRTVASYSKSCNIWYYQDQTVTKHCNFPYVRTCILMFLAASWPDLTDLSTRSLDIPSRFLHHIFYFFHHHLWNSIQLCSKQHQVKCSKPLSHFPVNRTSHMIRCWILQFLLYTITGYYSVYMYIRITQFIL
jgi:hypothetical protein